MIKAVLFDLDGTIINSEEGITKCVQYALRAYGIDEPDRTKLRCFIGPPLDPVFREKYGMTEAEAWQSVEKYRERFDVKGIFECSLYDGVREAIARFKEHGYLLALASSKPETACRRILEHFDLLGYFDEVVVPRWTARSVRRRKCSRNWGAAWRAAISGKTNCA